MPKFKIQHITKYKYEVAVRDSANQIMLYPVADDYQEVVRHTLIVSGSPPIEVHTDVFHNKVGTFTHSQPHYELVIDSSIEVLTSPRAVPPDTLAADEQWAMLQQSKNHFPNIEFLKLEPFAALSELEEVMNKFDHHGFTPWKCAQVFCDYVFSNFTYQKGITTVDTTLDEIWKLKSGVCQDFAHILLAMLRLNAIPARYVSGYICPNKNGMRGEGATHAWVEAYIPECGWVGLDPTNNCIANENHVRLAVGKNYYDCSPVRGTYRGTSNHTLLVAVTVGYEDGNSSAPPELVPEAIIDRNVNSFRRNQEMQMQQ